MFLSRSYLGLQNGLRFAMDPGGLGHGSSSSKGPRTGPSHRGSYEPPKVMTSPGQAQSGTQRAMESILTFLALFLDDSCSPHNKINVFSSTSKLYFLL